MVQALNYKDDYFLQLRELSLVNSLLKFPFDPSTQSLNSISEIRGLICQNFTYKIHCIPSASYWSHANFRSRTIRENHATRLMISSLDYIKKNNSVNNTIFNMIVTHMKSKSDSILTRLEIVHRPMNSNSSISTFYG